MIRLGIFASLVAHGLAASETLDAGARLVEITPKAESRSLYVADFRHAMAIFLKELEP